MGAARPVPAPAGRRRRERTGRSPAGAPADPVQQSPVARTLRSGRKSCLRSAKGWKRRQGKEEAAKPGFASRHNLKYWQLKDYIGFGPGAASCLGGIRYSYVKDLLYDSSYRSGKEVEVFLDCYGDMLDADVRKQIEEYRNKYTD